MGIVVVAAFAANAAGVLPDATSRSPDGGPIGRQYWQSIVLADCPAKLDRYIATLDIAGFAQPLAKGAHTARISPTTNCREIRSPASSAARAPLQARRLLSQQ